ncbi:MAG: hypothetical protein KF908_08750 [Nitrosomonas sp.]|nr:hypothetical protein [Nitrosomonas sp.]MCW5607109.1 hypothetical protein [Nitrosomonas sp.]
MLRGECGNDPECGMWGMGGAGKEKARLREGNRACVVRGKSPGSTAGCGMRRIGEAETACPVVWER